MTGSLSLTIPGQTSFFFITCSVPSKAIGLGVIGSDYDGVGDSLPIGLKDVAGYPSLVAEMLRRKYSEGDIEKVLGGNLMRVWKAVEAHAAGH